MADKQLKKRCFWAKGPLLSDYHDREWGVASRDERHLFEHLLLEIFQAGLSWSTILQKRENFRKAFKNFNPSKIARFGAKDIARLLQDEGIIRNQLKIKAAINNAKAFNAMKKEGISFSQFVWQFKPKNRKKTITKRNLPAFSEESTALAKALKAKGFTFVGPTGCYAFMQSVGIVSDHTKDCYKWRRPC